LRVRKRVLSDRIAVAKVQLRESLTEDGCACFLRILLDLGKIATPQQPRFQRREIFRANTYGKRWDDKPHWSPDGKMIYLLSARSGFFNVWAIRFDPVRGEPVGDPFAVTALDSPSQMVPKFIPTIALSLTQDRLVLTVAQESGDIWVLDNVDR
jgi:hypothetical protein